MRLLDLDLLAFGPFSGTRLDLGRQGVLHVIFGPNEAGKSTALRAITNLLYGIPGNTPDAHRHAMPDLRIGARITNGGPAVHVIRRKGNKNTLLAPDETPLPDDAISLLLGGIGEPLFRSMFGLDHVSLRDGAQALLHGKGTVGESLFAAGFGGRGVHAVLEQLEQEAAAIFKTRGQNPKLNEAIRLFKEAERCTRDAATSADAYRTQQDALRDARTECDSLAEKRRELAAEQNRLQRVLRVLPLMARRNEHSARRLALGEVPPLPDDSRPRRIAAQTTIRECERDRERLAREIDLLEHRRAELQPPASLLEIDEHTIKDLQDRLGSHRKAEEDLPRRRDELRRLEEEAVAIPQRLGRRVSLDQIESLRVSASQQALIRKLAQERSGLETAVTEAKRALEQRRIRQEQNRSQLAALPPAEDVQSLQTALWRAQRLGDIDGTIETIEKEKARLEEDLRQKVGSLGVSTSIPSSLAALPVPAMESVERFAERFEASDRTSDEIGKRRRDCHQRSLRVQRGLEELHLGGEVPSEEQLDEQRARRDATWQQIKRSWQAAEPADARAEVFEDEVRATDDVADRLRREADRVASRAKLAAELAECEREDATFEQEIRGIAAGRAELLAEWTALWKPAGVDPLAPAEMRTWLARFVAAVKVAENLAEKRLARVDLEEKRTRHRAELCAAYRQPGQPPEERIASFDGLLEVARGVLEERLACVTRRAELNRAIDEANAEISELERRHEESSRASEGWKRAWEQSVAPLGLSPGAHAVEALAVLDDLTELFGKMDAIRQLGRRVEGIVRDTTRFADLVAGLVQRHASNLSGLTATEAGDRLLRAYQQAQADQRERTAIEAALQAKHAERSECEQLGMNAASDLDALCQLAKVESAENLESAEEAAAEAAEIDRELRKIEAELYQAGEGATIDELVEQARGVEADSVRSRLQEVEAETEETQERRAHLLQQIGSWEEGLRHLEAGGRAADAAVEAQEHLAAIKSGVSKYVRLRLAALFLRREIERYRERAQGPLLARADKLFPRLTLGRYNGLRVGFDTGDDPVLRCLRDDGTEVGVEGLSDGTRDQLYLALRVATLEHHSESNDPMPVVLDDVLIHFDDERAAAALEVLAELAGRTQVLFFTHHQHLVDLARATLPETARVEHQLHLA